MGYTDKKAKEYNQQWYLANIDKLTEYGKNVPFDKAKNHKLWTLYKITLEDYNKIFAEQQGCCKICSRHQTMFKRSLNVDHDHITKKIRGLLCQNCNTSLGGFKDNIDLLLKAIEYLKSV